MDALKRAADDLAKQPSTLERFRQVMKGTCVAKYFGPPIVLHTIGHQQATGSSLDTAVFVLHHRPFRERRRAMAAALERLGLGWPVHWVDGVPGEWSPTSGDRRGRRWQVVDRVVANRSLTECFFGRETQNNKIRWS